MKSLLISLLLLLYAPLKADVVYIDYTIELASSFLFGEDSLNVILQNGRSFQRVKLRSKADNKFKLTYFIPCFSGRSLSEEEKIKETLAWNGSTINLYYEGRKEMVSVRAVTINIFEDMLESDSTYIISMEEITPDEQDIDEFKKRYFNFISLEAQLKVSGLERLLLRPDYSAKIKYKYLSNINLDHFTVAEINSLFKTSLPHSGTTIFRRYLNGSEVGQLSIITKNGHVHYAN